MGGKNIVWGKDGVRAGRLWGFIIGAGTIIDI
jgi:hypothetical protein